MPRRELDMKYKNYLFGFGVLAVLLALGGFLSFPKSADSRAAEFSEIEAPFDQVRVGVLSKYALREIYLFASCANLYAGSEVKMLEGALLHIQVKEEKLQVKSVSVSGPQVMALDGGHTSYEKLFQERDRKSSGAMQVGHLIVESCSESSLLEVGWGKQKRFYEGALEIGVQKRALQIINELPVEAYVERAALAELGPLPGMLEREARSTLYRLMETTVRSYLFHHRERHKKENFHLCDLTHCIHYPGLSKRVVSPPGFREYGEPEPEPEPEALISEDGKFLSAFFHSTCGGDLSSPDVFWQNHKMSDEYRSGRDVSSSGALYCKDSPHSQWSVKISASSMEQILKEKNLRHVRAVQMQNRVSYLSYTDRRGQSKKISASRFLSRAGRLLGWNRVKSNDFTIGLQNGVYHLKGHGLGHGVGLCQWGAMGQVDVGKSYQEILHFYYPGARLVKVKYH